MPGPGPRTRWLLAQSRRSRTVRASGSANAAADFAARPRRQPAFQRARTVESAPIFTSEAATPDQFSIAAWTAQEWADATTAAVTTADAATAGSDPPRDARRSGVEAACLIARARLLSRGLCPGRTRCTCHAASQRHASVGTNVQLRGSTSP